MNSPVHSFPQLVPARVKSVLDRLAREIWFDAQPVKLERTAVTRGAVPWQEARRSRLGRVTAPFHWGKLFEHTWFRVRVLRSDNERRWLRWRDQGEATLYVRGEPVAGFDVAHRTAPLPAGTDEVWVHSICCQSAIWHPDATGLDQAGSRFDGAETVRRNEAAWSCYHDLLVLHELSLEELKTEDPIAVASLTRPGGRNALARMSPRLRRLLSRLDRACNAYDTGGLAALQPALRAVYRNARADRDALQACLVGHAHIDLVWLWPERIGEAKAVHTFATVDRLLREYPEMRFTYSQPASYEAVARLAPGLFRRVQRRMNAKQWDATGAAYVESDTLLACGEALLRSFQLGQEWFQGELGKPAKTLWLPDVFGYAGCVPQIARMSGVEYFFTNKLTWSRITPFPHSSFVWRGADGSELVAHVSHETQQFYNGAVTLRELRDGARDHRQADVHTEFLVPTGYGDGGGGPTEEMCERARRVANLAGVPRTKWSTVERFFARLRRQRERLPVWTGEIYLEYHRGVYTTHGDLKAVFRAAERALQVWEAAHCASGRGPIDAQAWRRVVFAQFHDVIPGSSINEVYAEMRPELAQITAQAIEAANRAIGGGRGEMWFNPLPLPQTVIVPQQGELRAVALPALSGVAVAKAEGRTVAPARAARRSLDNGIVQARFNADGEIEQLTVRGRRVALAGAAARLSVHPDLPHGFDAWELDQHTLQLGEFLRGGSDSFRVERGGAEAVVEHTRRVGKASTLTTRYRLEAGAEVLRIDYDIDWHEPQALVKAVFPTTYRGQMARFGSPFGSVRREQWQGRASAEAQWEVPGSRWALVSDDSEQEGLMLLTEAKYGFGCRAGTLDVSLLRSAVITGESGKHARTTPKALRGGPEYPRFADLGRHRICLAVGLWTADASREQMPAALADTLFTRPFVSSGSPRSAGLIDVTEAPTLIPAWAKPVARGRWVLRLHETMGRRGVAQLQLAEGWRARTVGPLDRPGARLASAALPYGPYEVVSVLIERD